MSATPQDRDWRRQGLDGLAGLSRKNVPAAEILFLDAVAAELLGPAPPEPPYTIEHGSSVVSHLLRACAAAPSVGDLDAPATSPAIGLARDAVVDGAHAFAARGAPGLDQLVNRYLGAAVGELEQQAGTPEAQARSLFYFGLLAVASGPANLASQETADAILSVFEAWDAHIGEGFVPPWRVPSTN